MKINAVVWVLSLTAAGCLDWSQWGKSGTPDAGHASSQQPSGTEVVHAFEGAIDHSALPKVSLTTCAQGDRKELGVEASFAAGPAVCLAAGEAQEIERALREGTLSLVDLLLTARAIKKADFRLEGAESAVPGEKDEPVARGVHDLLLRIVHAHAADCQALCEGATAACGSRRSFGAGAPCAIAGKTKDEISAHFGADWCDSGFCPAMREARE